MAKQNRTTTDITRQATFFSTTDTKPIFLSAFINKTSLILTIVVLLIVGVCFIRYLQNPSFWLDEALVALSLRAPSLSTIFTRLERGLYFPRLYLTCIAGARELFGYDFWSLRLLPFMSFVAATLLWARLLARNSKRMWLPALLGGAFLLGSNFWLEQSVQLKQYSFDVFVALLPFTVSDEWFKAVLGDGKKKIRLVLLALPCFVSYTYPIALFARVIGWYLTVWQRNERRLNLSGLLFLFTSVALGLASIWFTDYRNGANLTGYWKDCILRFQLQNGVLASLRLLADFLWGWYPGKLTPLAIAVVVPLQILGVAAIYRRWQNRQIEDSQPLGSIILLLGVIAASILVSYPICAGRLTLFAQVHTQILAIEGAVFLLSLPNKRRLAIVFVTSSVGVMAMYSTHRFIRFAQTEPPENIRPLLAQIKPEMADTVWVHPCSVSQVESLPEGLPVPTVLLNTKKVYPPQGKTSWVLWTHMGDPYCVERLEEIRTAAKSWQVIAEGNGRALVLAEF